MKIVNTQTKGMDGLWSDCFAEGKGFEKFFIASVHLITQETRDESFRKKKRGLRKKLRRDEIVSKGVVKIGSTLSRND